MNDYDFYKTKTLFKTHTHLHLSGLNGKTTKNKSKHFTSRISTTEDTHLCRQTDWPPICEFITDTSKQTLGGCHKQQSCVCLECTFFCFSFLPLKHLLLWRQSLLQELHVKLILFLHLLLLPETHLIAYIALEAEAQRDHGVANATEMRNKKDTHTSGDQEVSKNKEMSSIS